MADLSLDLCGVKLKNPIIAASGTFGFGREYDELYDIGQLGGISVKGLSLLPRTGNPPSRIAETPSGMLNSVGLQNPGVEHLKACELPWLAEVGATAIVNVSGHSFDEYVQVIEALEDAPVDAYEVNISCPNVDAGGMTIGTHVESVEKVVGMCREATARPLIVKLTPNVTDIAEIARAAESAGADAISLINTLMGMAIDADRRCTLTSRPFAGFSGPAIKPVALRCVWQVCNAVNIPVIGIGGITCAQDVLEFILVGAYAVEVGTMNFVRPDAAFRIAEELPHLCQQLGIKNLAEFRGTLQL